MRGTTEVVTALCCANDSSHTPPPRDEPLRQRGRVVRALDLKSAVCGFKSHADHLAGVASPSIMPAASCDF